MNVVVKRVARSLRALAGLEYAGRGLQVWPDDIFLVSYPKSGNTWLRFLLGNLVNPQKSVTFANVESLVPSIYVNPDSKLRQLARPRILKSHESFVSRYGRVIYIVRDPRDVCVSYYHYLIKYREVLQGYPMDQFVPRFIADEFEHYGAWGDHVLSWLRMRQGSQDFMVLRYEEMLRDPQSELARVASFLKIEATPERLDAIVSLSSADRMRGLEKVQSSKWISTKRSRQDMPFVRTATCGGWKSALGQESVFQIEAAWSPVMRALGYELQSGSEEGLGDGDSKTPSGDIFSKGPYGLEKSRTLDTNPQT